jgi:protein gp37
MSVQMIPISQLFDHPDNPRLAPREDIVEQIAAQLNGHMDEAHALIVRPIDEGYQVISGHHRKLAATRKELTELPCWVREMSDDEAYMALVLNNAQGELHPLEVGIHALHSGKTLKEYADKTGEKHFQNIGNRRAAATVWEAVQNILNCANQQDCWLQLKEIHGADEWLWAVLVQHMLTGNNGKPWTVDTTKKHVESVKKIEAPPSWVNLESVTKALMDGSLKSSEVQKFAGIVAKTRQEITERKVGAEDYLTILTDSLASEMPGTLSQVQVICNTVLTTQADQINAERALAIQAQKDAEESAARVARLRQNIVLDEWEKLTTDEQYELLHLDVKGATFNKQKSKAIEWADWSWNPITGCLHGCPYCYARDITLDEKTKKAFPYGFEPTLKPTTLTAPKSQTPPKEATFDTRLKNVFTGSMSDIFGRWVPQAWIEAILDQVRAAPEWNFLFLTKFPNRMAEFEYPDNAWLGTTVDLQARVANAEKAFAKVNAKVKWLSIEPMLEPLQFTQLNIFDWIVIGGASPSTQTPTWQPPFIWIHELVNQAQAAGVRVYAKTNLLGNESRDGLLNLPDSMPIKPELTILPDVFHYLKGA